MKKQGRRDNRRRKKTVAERKAARARCLVLTQMPVWPLEGPPDVEACTCFACLRAAGQLAFDFAAKDGAAA